MSIFIINVQYYIKKISLYGWLFYVLKFILKIPLSVMWQKKLMDMSKSYFKLEQKVDGFLDND